MPRPRPVILVNGLPGAGKTTLARALSHRLSLPLFSKDTIKEAHADVLGAEPPPGWTQRRWNAALGAAASRTMWVLLADAPGGAVLESCWPGDVRHLVVRALQRARSRSPAEIWCEAPLATARRRFEARHPRHPIHGELPADADWERWQAAAQPLQIGPTLHVDTTGPVDVNAIIAWIRLQVPTGRLEPGPAPPQTPPA
ncbi:MAG: AAA family ATPase [Streptosporangiaceae bacterium]